MFEIVPIAVASAKYFRYRITGPYPHYVIHRQRLDLTPNDWFYVSWHSRLDLAQIRLRKEIKKNS